MTNIISLLLVQIQVLNNQIKFLLLFIAKNIPLKAKPSDWNSPKYNKLKVDKLPLVKVPSHEQFAFTSRCTRTQRGPMMSTSNM